MGTKEQATTRTHTRIVVGFLCVLAVVGVVCALILFPDAYYQAMFWYFE